MHSKYHIYIYKNYYNHKKAKKIFNKKKNIIFVHGDLIKGNILILNDQFKVIFHL
jgi:hypothetical protein